MNLPAINNKMKNHNIQFNNTNPNNNSLSTDGFGLGIQVFKIQSKKIIDTKNNNRNMIKNIQNPNQTYSYKPPLIPKPKLLPTIQKSNSNLIKKQRTSAIMSSKNNGSLMSDYSDKIFQRKGLMVQVEKSTTPNSSSMKKRVTLSLQKPSIGKSHSNSIKQQILNRNNNNKTSILTEIKEKSIGNPNVPRVVRKNQTVVQQITKNQQEYIDYHSGHRELIRFYSNYNLAEKQNLKQIRQLRKIKQNQENQQIFDHIEYLQTVNGIIDTVIDNQQKENHEIKLQKNQQNKNKKKQNSITIVPISGYQMTDYQAFQFYGISDYSIKNDNSGEFKIMNYENIDLAPISVSQQDQKVEKNFTKKIN